MDYFVFIEFMKAEIWKGNGNGILLKLWKTTR